MKMKKNNIKNIYDLNKELADIREIYNKEASRSLDKYGQKNDARTMAYFKILEIIRFYQIQRLHISNNINNDSNYSTLLKAIKMEHLEKMKKNNL